MASFSDYLELKVLDHIAGKGTLTLVTPMYLALTLQVPTDASTGTSIDGGGWIPTYTGYARKSVAAADFRSAGTPTPGQISNVNAITFAACTAGTSTIVGWALCDAATLGNIHVWGSCTSTVISTTQTPATVAVDQLVITLD